MEEKILNAINEKINNLTRDEEQCKAELGKFEGVLGQLAVKVELENDLKKIQTELETTKREEKYVNTLFKAKSEQEKIISKKSNLLKEKANYEKLIEEFSGRYSINDGKLGKTQEQIECENDLSKINAELRSIDLIENELSRTNRRIKTFMDKYKVKEQEQKEPETKEPETKEPETKEPETKEPETKEPETKEPETKEPETKEPETKEPETKEPETKEPETKEPETKEPETKEPEQKQQRTQIDPNAKNITISYIAKEDKYVVENTETWQRWSFKRKEIPELNLDKVAEKMGKDADALKYVDPNILRILMRYNKDLAKNYLDEVTEMGKSKETRNKDMINRGLKINYDLRGLYDRLPGDELDSKSVDAFSFNERQTLLNVANTAKDFGSATVKKGLKVKIFEKLDKLFVKKPSKRKMLAAGKENKDRYEKDDKEELSDEDKKKLKRLIKIKTKEVVNEPYGLQQDVLDKLEEINDPFPEDTKRRKEEQRSLKDRVQVDNETKERLDEVSEQHKDEKEEKEEKEEKHGRTVSDEWDIYEPENEK